jgi:hypothetical protein
MAYGKSSAQLEQEVEAQRSRLESRIDEIQRRLTPGRLIDEMLNYARTSSGTTFVNNLGRSVKANPLPVALTGVGLAWLMARANMPAESADTADTTDARIAGARRYARVQGSALRRLRQATDETGKSYVEFADEAGARFRATSDEMGNRAGQFIDQAGEAYHGFTDEAGNRVKTFLDETGATLVEAQGWASDAWEGAGTRLGAIGGGLAAGADAARRRAVDTGGQLKGGASSAGNAVAELLRQQPLVGGAIAFAIGAALASALPPTEQEDELVGETADEVKARASEFVGNAYEEGKQQLDTAFEEVREEAAAAYAETRPETDRTTGSVH